MEKKAQKTFKYIRNGELFYDSEGREAMAKTEAENIIKTIREIKPDIEGTTDKDITNNNNEDTENNERNEADFEKKIIDIFKKGPLKWKPSIDKSHQSSSAFKSTFAERSSIEDSRMKETNLFCGDAKANFEANTKGYVKFSMGEKVTANAEYNAKFKGCAEASYEGLFDKMSKTEENEREFKIAHCSAKADIEGDLEGSANFKAMGYEGKADVKMQVDAKGQTSFTGFELKSKKIHEGTEGKVRIVHAKVEGQANFKANGSAGNNKVNIEANAKGKAKFKAVDGKFVFAAKKRKDGGIYIPGFRGVLGEGKAKGEAKINVETEILGKKINKTGKVSGEAKASGFKVNALKVDIRKEKDYGTVIKAKASAKGGEVNLLNLEAIGKKKGDKKEISASVTGAKINAGNVNATGIDDRTIHKGKIETGLSADIGHINATLLGHKGTTAKVDAKLGVEMLNLSAGITRDTGVAGSTKVSSFNLNLTVGPPNLSVGFGLNVGIPFFSGGGGGGEGGVSDCKHNSNENNKSEEGSNIVNERKSEGPSVSSQNSNGNNDTNTSNAENTTSYDSEDIESDIEHTERCPMVADMDHSMSEQEDNVQISVENSESYINNGFVNRNVYGGSGPMEIGSVAAELHTKIDSIPKDNTWSYSGDGFCKKRFPIQRETSGNSTSMYKYDNESDQRQHSTSVSSERFGQMIDNTCNGKYITSSNFLTGNGDALKQSNVPVAASENSPDIDINEERLHKSWTPSKSFPRKRPQETIRSSIDLIAEENVDSNTAAKTEKTTTAMYDNENLESDIKYKESSSMTANINCSRYEQWKSSQISVDKRECYSNDRFVNKNAFRDGISIERSDADENTKRYSNFTESKDIGSPERISWICDDVNLQQFTSNSEQMDPFTNNQFRQMIDGNEKKSWKAQTEQGRNEVFQNVDVKRLRTKFSGSRPNQPASENKTQSYPHHQTSEQKSIENAPDSGVITGNLRMSGTPANSKSVEAGSISIDLNDEENYNRYLASLVNGRLDKSKGKNERSTKSENSGNKKSAKPIWHQREKVKNALIEKYTHGKKSENSSSEKKTTGDAKTGANSTNTENGENRSRSSSTQESDTTSKPKKKEEPKKPFGANKNIHTIFTMAGSDSKPVRYLKDNIACFCDE